jgi:RNA polymerase primary sigma factor
MSGRNLQRAHVLPYSDVSTYHLLWSDVVIVEASAFGTALDTETTETAEAEEGTTPKRKTTARKVAKKTARKSATKTSGRKSAVKKTTAKKKPAAKTAKKVARKAAKKAAGKKGK